MSNSEAIALHMRNHIVAKLTTFDLRGALHQSICIYIERNDHIEVRGACQDLLQRDIHNRISDYETRARLAFRNFAPRPAVDFFCAEKLLRHFITPVTESTFRELHDVALVHERHTLALELNRVADGAVDQAHAAAVADGLDADADLDVAWEIREADRLPEFFRFGLRAETNLLELFRKFLRQEIESLLRLRRASGVFDARIDVFRVFTEDDHVHLLRMLHRRRHAREPLHRAEADIQIEHLPQRHVQRTNAAADRRGQRSFDANEIFA